MRAVLLSIVLITSVSSIVHARSLVSSIARPPPAVIYPSSGRLPPEPNLWVASSGEPEISITSGDRRVPFLADDRVFFADGMRWVAVYPEIRAGTFTVTVGRTRARFTIDPALASRDHEVGDQLSEDEYVQFERMTIDETETLMIEARTPPSTVMYFLNHEVPEHHPHRWAWIGPGRAMGRSTRYELPLARLGVSCAGTRSITLSLYSSGLDRGATLYPLTELAVDRGRVKLPVEHLLQDEADKRWLPCPGASVRAGEPPGPPDPSDPPLALPLARQSAIAAGEPARSGPSAGPAPRSSSRPWWWSGVLAIAAVLCAWIAHRAPARHPT